MTSNLFNITIVIPSLTTRDMGSPTPFLFHQGKDLLTANPGQDVSQYIKSILGRVLIIYYY